MTRRRYLLICFALAGILAGCNRPTNLEVNTIGIKGVSWACNISTSYGVFGSSSESEEQLEVVLPASDGDLLYMLHDDLQLYYRYRPEHGTQISLTFDTLDAVSVYLNGSLEYIELSEPSSLEIFRQLSEAEIKQLSTISIYGSISGELLLSLKEREIALQGKGLVLEGGPDLENFNELLSICRPSLLVITDSWSLPEPSESSLLSSMELLWINGNLSTLAKVAPCCANLESLIIGDWEPGPGEMLPLSDLKKLQCLTIAESELTSLSVIEFPQSLRKLHLIDCDTLSDITRLADLPGLKGLSLSLCDQLKNVEQIKEINSLQWFSFPPDIAHNEFQQLVERFTQLEVVELLGCTNIANLAPLEALPDLHTLILQLDKEQLGRLDALKQLKTLILTDEVFDDNQEWIKELKNSLPETNIVPGSGLCLGSGWLLLLLPFVLIFRYYFRLKN
jgi:hypothetical protein